MQVIKRVAGWLLILLLFLAFLVFLQHKGSKPLPLPPQQEWTPVQEGPKIVEAIPTARREARVVEVVVRDTVRPADTVGTIRIRRILVAIPADPSLPLLATGEGEVRALEVARSPIRVAVGVGCTTDLSNLSPALTISAIHVGSLSLGATTDLTGIAVSSTWEVWREWGVQIRWTVLQFQQDARKLGVGLTYRITS